MTKILDQLCKLVDNEGITITKLESNIGASKGVLSRAIANSTDIQSKWISKIVENYPRYSVEWLLTGKGEMLKQTESEIQKQKSENISMSKEVFELFQKQVDTIKSQQRTIEELTKKITP